MRYATGKKCPSGQDNDVHGWLDGSRIQLRELRPRLGIGGRFIAPGNMTRLSSHSDASERAYRNLESMKITLAVSIPGPDEIDTSIYHPAYAWHAWETAERGGEEARRDATSRGLTMHNSPYLRRAAPKS